MSTWVSVEAVPQPKYVAIDGEGRGTAIECWVTFDEEVGPEVYEVHVDDPEPDLQDLWLRLIAGEWGEVADYTAPEAGADEPISLADLATADASDVVYGRDAAGAVAALPFGAPARSIGAATTEAAARAALSLGGLVGDGVNAGVGGAASNHKFSIVGEIRMATATAGYGLVCMPTLNSGDVPAFIGSHIAPTIKTGATTNVYAYSAGAPAAQPYQMVGTGTLVGTSLGDVVGYYASPGLAGGTGLNAGFWGGLVSGTGSYNLYMVSAAANYIAGNVGLGITDPNAKLVVAGIVKPGSDNAYTLGTSGRRWSVVYAATGTINTSDVREKTDVVDLPPALDLLCRLRTVSYRWKVGGVDVEEVVTRRERPIDEPELDEAGAPILGDDGAPVMRHRIEIDEEISHIERERPGRRVHFGLIAQEVKAVADDVGVDFAGYVYDAETDHHGLRYDQFIAPLIRAVQELAEQNRSLAARIAALEER